MYQNTDTEMQVGEIDAMYLRCILAHHDFKNPTLQSFMNELREVIEDIAQTQTLHNHVDESGNFVISVKVESEDKAMEEIEGGK